MFVNGMGKKKALDYYYSNINLFLNNNFTVYFKAHPREIDDTLKVLKEHYKNNSKFKIIENSLPIEAYNNEFSIVAGTFSGTLISVPHFHKIPSASLNCDEMYNSKYSLSWKKFFIISEYYTPCIEFYKEILHLPNKEFREKSKEIYSKYIHSKKQITSNVDLIKILNYKKSLFKDIFYGILNLGTHARKDFYDTIKNIQKEIRKK